MAPPHLEHSVRQECWKGVGKVAGLPVCDGEGQGWKFAFRLLLKTRLGEYKLKVDSFELYGVPECGGFPYNTYILFILLWISLIEVELFLYFISLSKFFLEFFLLNNNTQKNVL